MFFSSGLGPQGYEAKFVPNIPNSGSKKYKVQAPGFLKLFVRILITAASTRNPRLPFHPE
jgi:hypothetical protein